MNLAEIKKSALKEIETVENKEELGKIRSKYIGRKGKLTTILRSLKDLPLERRREIGPAAQNLKKELEEVFEKKAAGYQLPLANRQIDFSTPGKKIPHGHLHPLTLVEDEARHIFRSMNFSVVEGPEIESEYYNFDALNMPVGHPAREMWDTFWLENGADARTRFLLRTHTSPMQVRYMEMHQPPLQIIVPGRVFRYEATDASHEINFYQLEGLMVGKNISLANFKFVIEEFFKRFFGSNVEFRYRPSYFPFTEPSLEVDVRLGDGGRWLETVGAGMVHPRVFEYARYNPRDWQGFAFGVGLDRLAMLKYKVPDIRLFYSGDLRFIRQF